VIDGIFYGIGIMNAGIGVNHWGGVVLLLNIQPD
jgi:hypothetical protein